MTKTEPLAAPNRRMMVPAQSSHKTAASFIIRRWARGTWIFFYVLQKNIKSFSPIQSERYFDRWYNSVVENESKNTASKTKRWQLLFVRDDGKTIAIRHFKGIVFTVCMIGGILAAALAMLWFYTGVVLKEKSALEAVVASKARELAGARKKATMMMAELAIAEAKLKHSFQASASKKLGSETESEEKESEQAEPNGKPENPLSSLEIPVGQTDMAASLNSVAKPADVSVETPFFCYDPESGTIHAEFKVINVMEKKQPISGYVYMILKDGAETQDHWLVLPKTKLVNGAPAEKKGARFRIYNYRTMKLSTTRGNPNLYRYATVFVYHQETGELMLERDIDIPSFQPCP
jgi:hypothetical protein